MSRYNARVPADKQYQLIMECRGSGLTDFQWCKEHGIHPGTFYNWVSRLRKEERTEPMFPVRPVLEDPSRISELSARIEISLGGATIRIANGADPALLERILSLVGGTVC